jgi:hypothetical protein
MESLTPLLFIFATVAVLAIVANREQKKTEPVSTEKRCAPHKWQWVDQPGIEGAVFIRCDWCGMIPSAENRD